MICQISIELFIQMGNGREWHKEHQDNSIDNNHELNPNNTTDTIDLDDNDVDTDINLNDNLETEAIEDEVSNSDSTQVIDEVDDISNEI